jgi:hypothetical protein
MTFAPEAYIQPTFDFAGGPTSHFNVHRGIGDRHLILIQIGDRGGVKFSSKIISKNVLLNMTLTLKRGRFNFRRAKMPSYPRNGIFQVV